MADLPEDAVFDTDAGAVDARLVEKDDALRRRGDDPI
jgi:hypothetical protein